MLQDGINVGMVLEAVSKSKVRCGVEMDSEAAGELAAGELLTVLGLGRNRAGQLRVRHSRGWSSVVTAGSGRQLLRVRMSAEDAASSEDMRPASVNKRAAVAAAEEHLHAAKKPCLDAAEDYSLTTEAFRAVHPSKVDMDTELLGCNDSTESGINVGMVLEAVSKSKVRCGVEMDSEAAGELAAGELLTVLGIGRNRAGQLRVRHSRGWSSVVTAGSGRQLLWIRDAGERVMSQTSVSSGNMQLLKNMTAETRRISIITKQRRGSPLGSQVLLPQSGFQIWDEQQIVPAHVDLRKVDALIVQLMEAISKRDIAVATRSDKSTRIEQALICRLRSDLEKLGVRVAEFEKKFSFHDSMSTVMRNSGQQHQNRRQKDDFIATRQNDKRCVVCGHWSRGLCRCSDEATVASHKTQLPPGVHTAESVAAASEMAEKTVRTFLLERQAFLKARQKHSERNISESIAARQIASTRASDDPIAALRHAAPLSVGNKVRMHFRTIL
eukprot:SAG31_NODE_101_length_25195_cov_67.436758_15_plen_497_part_00